MSGLTPRQRELLAYVREHPDASYREIRDALGLKSISQIGESLSRLARKGYIRRLAYRARAIEPIRAELLSVGESGVASVRIHGEPFLYFPVEQGAA